MADVDLSTFFMQGVRVLVDRFEKFIFTISEIDRYWHRVAADEMAKYGLKGPYVIYLVTMNRHCEGLTASQLCEICGRNKADVSRAVRDMESKGLVKKVSENGNLYRAKLVLTNAGRDAAKSISNVAAKAVEFGGKGITDDKRTVFYEILGLISENLKELSEKGLSE